MEEGRAERAAERDGEFYIEGADCVIRVEDTLFRVHRFFLARDSSAFQHMYSTPVHAGDADMCEMDGFSDTNPIYLYGESAARFRALLSVLYALPPQLQAYNTPSADLDRLLTIAEMTNKYHFITTEFWAVDALYNVTKGLHGPVQDRNHLDRCSSEWMKRLMEVALLCGHVQLRDHVAEKWVDRINSRELRPVHALDIADRCGALRRLRGYAYYVQLIEMGPDLDPGFVEDGRQYAQTTARSHPNPERVREGGTRATLTAGQKQRLLSGHFALARRWERVRATPPAFARPAGCTYHQHGCVSTWATVWSEVGRAEATAKHGSADVLGRLRAMEEQLVMHADMACALTPACRRAAVVAVKGLVKDVQDGLADCFANLAEEDAGPEGAVAG